MRNADCGMRNGKKEAKILNSTFRIRERSCFREATIDIHSTQCLLGEKWGGQFKCGMRPEPCKVQGSPAFYVVPGGMRNEKKK
jgi:hypothetical protein